MEDQNHDVHLGSSTNRPESLAKMELPELPEEETFPAYSGYYTAYTADQMRAYGEQCALAEREKWKALAIAAAEEAAGWYDEARGRPRNELPAVVAVDEAIRASDPA